MFDIEKLNLYENELEKVELELKNLKNKKTSFFLYFEIFYCYLLIFKIKSNNKKLVKKIKKIVEDYE